MIRLSAYFWAKLTKKIANCVLGNIDRDPRIDKIKLLPMS